MADRCIHCNRTGYIPQEGLPDQMCPHCEIGRAIIKGYNAARTIGIQAADTLRAANEQLQDENKMLRKKVDDFEKEKQERERITIMNMPTLREAMRQALSQQYFGMLKIDQEFLEKLCVNASENKELREEMKKKKGAAGVLQQIVDKLKSLTGEQNVWKAIEKLQADKKRLREALSEYGRHGKRSDMIMCEKSKHSNYPCTCGFEQALRQKGGG